MHRGQLSSRRYGRTAWNAGRSLGGPSKSKSSSRPRASPTYRRRGALRAERRRNKCTARRATRQLAASTVSRLPPIVQLSTELLFAQLSDLAVVPACGLAGGKNGHQSRDCPLPRNSTTCYECGETGHLSRDCPRAKSSTVCFHCGKEGHFSTACTERAVTVACRHCGDHAHLSRDCPTSLAWKATQPCRLFQKSGACSRVDCLFKHVAAS